MAAARSAGAGHAGAVIRLSCRLAAVFSVWLLTICLPWAGARAAAAAISTASAATWQWPLAGRPRVVRGFDPPATPYGPGHRGVDLSGEPGMPVRAAGAGIVGYAGSLAGRGVVTVLHAGGLRTTYEPVLATVRAGRNLMAGEVLGRLVAGHPGCPAAACLHWGLLRGTTYLDPLSLLGLAQVRLLPLNGPGGPAAGPRLAPGRSAAFGAAMPRPPPLTAGGWGDRAVGLTGLIAAGTVGMGVLSRRRNAASAEPPSSI